MAAPTHTPLPPSSVEAVPGEGLERRGRKWLVLSFLFCPCHLPVTLALLAMIGGGTALGSAVSGNIVLAAVILTAIWAYGTARGFRYVHRANKGELSCAVPGQSVWRRYLWP